MESEQPNSQKPTQEQLRRHFAEGKQKMKKKLLALGYDMKFDKPESRAEEMMERWRVNMNHVNRWFLKSERSAVRKEMDKMTYQELVKAVTQFEEIKKDYDSRIA